MKNLAASYTVMSPTHSVEQAYHEWVIKAVELIVQSRVILDETFRQSRQFALNLPEKFDARNKIICDSKQFFHNRATISLHVIFGGIIVEEWVFSFDSASDVIPTARSERRDQTLPRRLTVALRSLMSLTRLLRVERNVVIELHENGDGGVLTPSSRRNETLTRIDVCSVPSSFGNLILKVFTRDSSTVTTRAPSACRTPAAGSGTPRNMLIDETFIQNHSLVSIQMVIETAPAGQARSMPVIPVPLSKSPARELTEIWPTSSLSYPASPRERNASSDSGFGSENELPGSCLVAVPQNFFLKKDEVCVTSTELGRSVQRAVETERIFERPVSISSITEFIDQLKRTRQKSVSR
jgi:hypothetical protein